MSDKNYEVKYKLPRATSVTTTTVRASSVSQAKEQVISRFNGDVSIVSAVERR